MQISVVIPVYGDGEVLGGLLAELAPLRGQDLEVIVVEGLSQGQNARFDGVGQLAPELNAAGRFDGLVDAWHFSRLGRAQQMQVGVNAAQHDLLWFVHADNAEITAACDWLRRLQGVRWGRFDIGFDAPDRLLKVIASMMNWRSRRTAICTGDQAIFVHKSLLKQVGGWPQQQLMEDIELSKRLKRQMLPLAPTIRVTTSARRWLTGGVVRTILFMWCLRLMYFFGIAPERLHALYYPDNAADGIS